jgi:hypothetical protein
VIVRTAPKRQMMKKCLFGLTTMLIVWPCAAQDTPKAAVRRADNADRIEDKITALSQAVLLMDERLSQIRTDIAGFQATLRDLPNAYVPRKEHDLRDQQLNVSVRLARLEDRLDNWTAEAAKLLLAGVVGSGSVFAGQKFLRRNGNAGGGHT